MFSEQCSPLTSFLSLPTKYTSSLLLFICFFSSLFWIWIPCGRQYKCSCHKQNCPKLFDIQKRHTKSTPADEPNDKIYKQICIFFFALCCSIFGLNQRFDRFGIGFINPFLRRNCSPLGKHSFFGWFFFFLLFVHLNLRFSRRLCGCYGFVWGEKREKKATLLKLNQLMCD